MGTTFTGNVRVLACARRDKKHDSIHSRIEALEQRETVKDQKIAFLEDRVQALTSSLDAYKPLRHRFISTFKRELNQKLTGDRSARGTHGRMEGMLWWMHSFMG